MQASWILLFIAFFGQIISILEGFHPHYFLKRKKRIPHAECYIGLHTCLRIWILWVMMVSWITQLVDGSSYDQLVGHKTSMDSLMIHYFTPFMKNRLDYWERNWFLGWWVTDIIIWPSLHGLKFEPVLASYYSSKKISHIQFSNCIWRAESFDILFTLVPY